MKSSCAEKRWVVLHPFVAKKAWEISSQAKTIAGNIEKDTILDGDGNGGQVDAFRHTLWMAMLNQKIHWRKAKSLGKAHEKGNKQSFKKGLAEDGELPDYKSCEMDFLNNDVGMQFGFDYDTLSVDSLVKIIILEIKQGNLWVIKKDKQGNYLDIEGHVISKEALIGKWYTEKCIVPSNYSSSLSNKF